MLEKLNYWISWSLCVDVLQLLHETIETVTLGQFPFIFEICVDFQTLKDYTTKWSCTVSKWRQIATFLRFTHIVFDGTFFDRKCTSINETLNKLGTRNPLVFCIIHLSKYFHNFSPHTSSLERKISFNCGNTTWMNQLIINSLEIMIPND